MKKIILGIVIIILVILIYDIFKDSKVYYVSIGDFSTISSNIDYGYKNYIEDYLDEKSVLEKYVNIYNAEDRVTDIIRNITDNKEYGGKKIQNILIKADILTISIGYNDIISKVNKYNTSDMMKYIDSYLKDLEELYKIVRVYDKEDIIMIGYYNPYDPKYNKIIDYLNDSVSILASNYKIYYINVSDLKKYIVEDRIDIEGHHIIFDRLRYILDNNIKRK